MLTTLFFMIVVFIPLIEFYKSVLVRILLELVLAGQSIYV